MVNVPAPVESTRSVLETEPATTVCPAVGRSRTSRYVVFSFAWMPTSLPASASASVPPFATFWPVDVVVTTHWLAIGVIEIAVGVPVLIVQ